MSSFFSDNKIKLLVLLSVEATTYIISYIKFKKEIATHSIGAKIWTLILFATLIDIMFHCQSTILFAWCFWIGIITRVEIISIVLILKLGRMMCLHCIILYNLEKEKQLKEISYLIDKKLY